MALAPLPLSISSHGVLVTIIALVLAVVFSVNVNALQAYPGMACNTALNCDSTTTRLSCGAYGSYTPLTVCLCDAYPVGLGRNHHTVSPYWHADIRKCVLPEGEPCVTRPRDASASSVPIRDLPCRPGSRCVIDESRDRATGFCIASGAAAAGVGPGLINSFIVLGTYLFMLLVFSLIFVL